MNLTPKAGETAEETTARIEKERADIKLSEKKSAEQKAKNQAWSDAKKANGGVAPLVQPETDETRRATADRQAAEAETIVARTGYKQAQERASKARNNDHVPVSSISICRSNLTVAGE